MEKEEKYQPTPLRGVDVSLFASLGVCGAFAVSVDVGHEVLQHPTVAADT